MPGPDPDTMVPNKLSKGVARVFPDAAETEDGFCIELEPAPTPEADERFVAIAVSRSRVAWRLLQSEAA